MCYTIRGRMKKFTVVFGIVSLSFLAGGNVYAQLAVPDTNTKTQRQVEQTRPARTLTQPTPVSRSAPIQVQPASTTQNPALNKTEDKENSWFGWWWRAGFWAGLVWIFPWVFVGWQWTKYKFWGFGWPWPWWFWFPLVWFIPWLVVGWWEWLVWWPWWVWGWWIWPWIFWPIWWLIVFKEAMIWMWKRG